MQDERDLEGHTSETYKFYEKIFSRGNVSTL